MSYDSDRILSSKIVKKRRSDSEWSLASNESLFSIHMGNESFSMDGGLTPDAIKSPGLPTVIDTSAENERMSVSTNGRNSFAFEVNVGGGGPTKEEAENNQLSSSTEAETVPKAPSITPKAGGNQWKMIATVLRAVNKASGDDGKKKKKKNDEFVESLARIAVAQICDSVGLQGCQVSALNALSNVMCKYVQDLGKEREARASFLDSGVMPKVDCVPSWLPCFPDAKTYTSSGSVSVEETEILQVDQDKKVVETSLLKLERRLASNGFHVPVFEPGVNGGREQVSNPFLVYPLEYGEKVVSLVLVPERLVVEEDVVQSLSLWAKDVSPLGRFAPVAVEKRPAVKLKFQIVKKSLATGSRDGKRGNLEAISWFADDDSRVEKKRKKEIIVNGSFENGKRTEMTQL
uniref:Transcription initiation factor TFIID subunit 8-like n=1 Tax=Tanacetum cinerariifolium TaxID=118510 RepID=A0A6L2LX24_TANCI|nr:transcription initiation factor TFIID subunit 8-like [Tanacetum cinerariifolium]